MTNETKHTPGPWHVESDDTIRSKDFSSIMMGDYRGVIVASVEPGHAGRDHARPEAAANAALIAAAPELLEACEALSKWFDGSTVPMRDYNPTVAQARAAIAAAGNKKEDK